MTEVCALIDRHMNEHHALFYFLYMKSNCPANRSRFFYIVHPLLLIENYKIDQTNVDKAKTDGDDGTIMSSAPRAIMAP